jgi:hypothetical protein
MIRFKLDELIEQIPAFHGSLARRKRERPPGKWRPWLQLSYVTRQDEDNDKWVAWLKWELMEGEGSYPCRDAAKSEWISRMDPPDRHPTERVAELFAERCVETFREQYMAWIKSDFSNPDYGQGQ